MEVLGALVAVTDRREHPVPAWSPSLACTRLSRLLLPVIRGAQQRAVGRVLDLRGPLATGFAYGNASELLVSKHPCRTAQGTFDTVCSFGVLSAALDLRSVLESVHAFMGGESRFLFVELDGGAARWRRLLDGPVRLFWGISASRDISGALWSTGFELLYLNRRVVYLLGFAPVRVVFGVARKV